MIQNLTISDLDIPNWDRLVLKADGAPFYCLSQVLKGLHRNWNFIVQTENAGEYGAGIALPVKNFLGLKRIVQPAFCQQLGIINLPKNSKSIFLAEAISHSGIRHWAYHFNESDQPIIKEDNLSWIQKDNLVLGLEQDLELIRGGYSKNLKRKLKDAEKSGLSIQELTFKEYWPVYLKQYKSLGTGTPKRALENLRSVLEKDLPNCKKSFMVVGNSTDKNLAGGIFIGFKKRITYWSGFSNQAGKDKGAMAYLMNEMIGIAKGSYDEFDFETGNLEGTRRFFLQFRPEERHFPFLGKR